MPERNNQPPANKGGGDPPVFTLLRQYLTMMTGRDPVEEVHKSRKARVSRSKDKVYVKKMNVRMEKKSRATPPKSQRSSEDTEERSGIEDISVMPELERSLQQYISRRQAALSRYAVKPPKKDKDVLASLPPVPQGKAEPKQPAEQSAATPAPTSWKRLVQMLPFMSEAVLDTAERTEKLEKTLQKNEATTQEMAKRLQEAENLLSKTVKSVEPKPTQTTRALSKAERDQLQQNLGRIQSIEKESAPVSDEVITKDDMGGLKKVKETSTFGLTKKKKEGFFSSLFGGFREAAADIRDVNREAKVAAQATTKEGAKAAAPKVVPPAAPAAAVKLGGGMLVRKAAPQEDLSKAKDDAPHTEEAPKDDAGLGSLVTAFAENKTGATPAAPAQAAKPAQQKPTPQTKEERKKEEASRKEKLANEEKRAEYMMMSAAAKRPKQKEAGFFTQLNASLQYMGMAKERLAIVQNLATMLNAGLPLIDALRTLQMESKNRATKKLLSKINAAVENGSSLWRAMDDQHFFSPHAIALIRIGEEAGNLAQNMLYLADQQEKDQGLREKVKMAMIYPAIVLVLMFIVVMGLGLFVLPQLVQVLFNLNVKLPFITRVVIAFSNGFSEHGLIVVPSIIGGGILLVILGKFTRFKVVVQWVIFKIPGIGPLARQATLARFGVILGGLLEAGVPLVEALRSLVEVTPIVSYKRFYRRILEHVTVGDSFAKSFAVIPQSNKLFPISVQQLIITGERTGSLSKIMLKVSEIYEKEANNTAQKLPVILEPMLLLFIGGLVGTIAFAIIIPIYSVVGNVSR